VDGSLLLDRLDQLAATARRPGGGVTRLAWSEEDRAARALVCQWAAGGGLRVRTDAVGNLIAELGGSVPGLAPLVTGSHLDTVVDAGPLDGAYGAVAAFTIVAALAAAGERLRHPVRAVAWANEEGVVAPPFTGSRAAAGAGIDLDALGPDGRRLAERLAGRLAEGLAEHVGQGLAAESGGAVPPLAGAAWGPVAGYLELHIEQGPVLEQAAVPIGVVTGITGAQRGWARFQGQANHAGTTPMHLRSDALVAAAHAVLAVQRLATDGPVTVATAGVIEAEPGNTNVVPGRAAVSVDLRSLDGAALSAAWARLGAEVDDIATRTATRATLVEGSRTEAVLTDARLRDAVAGAAHQLGLATMELASGAGHDAQSLALLGPVGMIFVPSIGGLSHHPDEATAPADLVAGAEVLLGALRRADQRLDP
jgi:hydantoinase/carbamoylase family amidase